MAKNAVEKQHSDDQIILLARLSNAAGVSGAEAAIRAIILETVKDAQAEINEDALGNLILHRPSQDKKAKKIMLTAHMDETGFIITADEGEGLYAFSPVGEVDIRQLPGKPVLIGKDRTPGVIGARAIHLTTAEQRQNAIPISTLRIDVGPNVKVAKGERAVFGTEFWQNGSTLFGKAFDNRLGVAAVIELLKTAPSEIDLYCVFSSQKELGNRGEMVATYNINPDFVILVDTANAADFPTQNVGDENHFYESKLGKGPVIYPMQKKIISDAELFEFFIRTAEKEMIPYQIGQAGTIETRYEASGAINKVRDGMRSINISIPARYPHTAIGVTCLTDWENTIKLLQAGLTGMAEW